MSSNSPCAACKLLRRKCTQECVFAPYFPPENPQKFACVHRVFGASNVTKLLNELNVAQREDAVNSLAYEATERLKDPVYGCVGLISLLQQKLAQVQNDLTEAKKELATYIGPQAMLPMMPPPMPQSYMSQFQQYPNNMPALSPNVLVQPQQNGGSGFHQMPPIHPQQLQHAQLLQQRQQQQQLFDVQVQHHPHLAVAENVAAREQNEMYKTVFDHQQQQAQQDEGGLRFGDLFDTSGGEAVTATGFNQQMNPGVGVMSPPALGLRTSENYPYYQINQPENQQQQQQQQPVVQADFMVQYPTQSLSQAHLHHHHHHQQQPKEKCEEPKSFFGPSC